MKTETKQMLSTVPAQIHTWIKEQASEQERSMNWIINKILAQAKEAADAKNTKQA
ncbi:hypothetical protein [Comamonas aquatica]|uniref:hypothetical protein n=1 Tax=Comamonas aquatica TaxID=225991 RepID=UPI0034D5F3D6